VYSEKSISFSIENANVIFAFLRENSNNGMSLLQLYLNVCKRNRVDPAPHIERVFSTFTDSIRLEGLGARDFQVSAAVLSQAGARLRELTITDTIISDAGDQLVALLASAPGLESFSLQKCQLPSGPEFAQRVIAIIASGKVTSLTLSGLSGGSELISIVCGSLEALPRLRTLSLQRTTLSSDVMAALLTHLPRSGIQVLDLRYCGIGSQDGRKLLDMVEKHPGALQNVRADYNNFSAATMAKLREANRTLGSHDRKNTRTAAKEDEELDNYQHSGYRESSGTLEGHVEQRSGASQARVASPPDESRGSRFSTREARLQIRQGIEGSPVPVPAPVPVPLGRQSDLSGYRHAELSDPRIDTLDSTRTSSPDNLVQSLTRQGAPRELRFSREDPRPSMPEPSRDRPDPGLIPPPPEITPEAFGDTTFKWNFNRYIADYMDAFVSAHNDPSVSDLQLARLLCPRVRGLLEGAVLYNEELQKAFHAFTKAVEEKNSETLAEAASLQETLRSVADTQQQIALVRQSIASLNSQVQTGSDSSSTPMDESEFQDKVSGLKDKISSLQEDIRSLTALEADLKTRKAEIGIQMSEYEVSLQRLPTDDDGSSLLGPQKRFAAFPAFAAAREGHKSFLIGRANSVLDQIRFFRVKLSQEMG